MSQSGCFSQYYNSLLQVGYSVNQLVPEDQGAGEWVVKATRPFIPFAGLTNIPGLDSMVNNQTFRDVFKNLFDECYAASVNKVAGIGSFPQIADGAFDQYLYKKINASPVQNLARYNDQANTILDFWISIDLGQTQQMYFEAVQRFIDQARKYFDKSLFIAPGEYRFNVPSGNFVTNWVAWKAASVNLEGIKILEIESI